MGLVVQLRFGLDHDRAHVLDPELNFTFGEKWDD